MPESSLHRLGKLMTRLAIYVRIGPIIDCESINILSFNTRMLQVQSSFLIACLRYRCLFNVILFKHRATRADTHEPIAVIKKVILVFLFYPC